jgi:hypothetical protein
MNLYQIENKMLVLFWMLKYIWSTRFLTKRTPKNTVLIFDYDIKNFRIFFKKLRFFWRILYFTIFLSSL